MYISACRHDPNPVSTVRHKFLWSSNTTDLARTLAGARVALRYDGSVAHMDYTLFHVYCWLFTALFNLRLTLTSEIVTCNSVVLLNPENMSLTVGISLISCIPVEFSVIVRVLPVNGSHFDYRTTNSDVREYSH